METLVHKMREIILATQILGVVFCCAGTARCEEAPEPASICEVKNNPAAFNHKFLELTGFVEHGFEDFTFLDPHCPARPEIWLEYGGTVKSGTMYCCGVTAGRQRPDELVVEKISIPFVQNEQFKTFDHLIHLSTRPDGYAPTVHATFIGRFFAGKEMHYPKATFWGGYGHMGCCSLFVIQEVSSVDAKHRNDLDYEVFRSPYFPSDERCRVQPLMNGDWWRGGLDTQKKADAGEHTWVFNDPKRVAAEALSQVAGEKAASKIELMSAAPGRMVYDSKQNERESYEVTVTRPYWLSFYAHDPKQIAWLVLTANALHCGKENAKKAPH